MSNEVTEASSVFWPPNMNDRRNKIPIRRKNNFYEKYTNYCKLKIVRPLPLPKKNLQRHFDICGDRVDVGNWLAIIDSLAYDDSLMTIAIRLRKSFQEPIANINSVNKLRKIPCQVPIATKILFVGLVRSVSQCLSVSRCLTSLILEGLPLISHYTHLLLDGLSQNRSIERVSFDRCPLGDVGFEAVCASIKYMPNIESFSACQCNLTHSSCDSLAALITSQCVYRFSEGWMHSLRYRQIDVKSIRGIKLIALNGNEMIGDKGVRRIIEALIDDEWIETVQLRECGLTNDSADMIIDYLKRVGSRMTFDVTRNRHLSKHCADEILTNIEDNSSAAVRPTNKQLIAQLKDEIECLSSQLSTEKSNRMRSDELNLQLRRKVLNDQDENQSDAPLVPDGFVLLSKDALEALQARVKMAQEVQVKSRSRRSSATKMTKSLYTQKKAHRMPKVTSLDCIGDSKANKKKYQTLRKSEKSAMDARAIFFGSSETSSNDSDSKSSDQDLDLNE